MAFDFPASPTVGQTYAPVAGILYTWNGYAWAGVQTPTTPGFPVQIARVDVSSAVASVNFTSGIDGTYDEYEFHVYGFKPTVDAFLLMRFSQDGGATFKFGASDYQYIYTGFGANNAAQNFGGAASSLFLGSARVFAGAGFGGVCRGSLYQPNSSTMRKYIHWAASSTGTVTSWAATGGGNYVPDTNAVNAIQFLTDAGNILAGTFVLYGIKK